CCLGDAPPALDRAVFFGVGTARAAQLLSEASLRPCWVGGQTLADLRNRGSGVALRNAASSVPRRESEGRTDQWPWALAARFAVRAAGGVGAAPPPGAVRCSLVL